MTIDAAAVASAAGCLTFVAVLLVAISARRPAVRRPQRSPYVGEPGPASAVRRWLRPGLVVLGAVAASLVAGPLAGPVVLVVAALLRATRRRSADRRRRRSVDASMPDTVELFVLCVHAGLSPAQTIEELAGRAPPPVRPVFAAVALQLHRGRSVADALGVLADDAGSVGRELAASIATAEREGLPLLPVLDRLSDEARAARRRAGEAAARRLPVQLSFPLVVCTLPSFVLLAIAPAVLGALSTLRGRAP